MVRQRILIPPSVGSNPATPANKKATFKVVFLLARSNWFGPTDELVRSRSVSEVDAIGGPEFTRDKLPCNLQPFHPSQNRQVARNSDFFVILQALITFRVQRFSKRSFFSPTRTQNSKNPLFSMLLSWELKKSSQRKADVFRLKFDVKRCSYNTLIATAISG